MNDTITKAEYLMLEKMFVSEMDHALNGSRLPCCFQSKAKLLEAMESKGLVERVEFKLGGRFSVTISGWALTHSGRLTYCENSDEPAEPTEPEIDEAEIARQRREKLEAAGQQRLIA